MMSKEEFNAFLPSIGGLVDGYGTRPAEPFYLFGCECDDGWLELIAELIRELIDADWTREIKQIKEKFGGLRFYAEGLPENGHEIIVKYETRAWKICEICGSEENVQLRVSGWVKTLCDQCAPPWFEKRHLSHLRIE